jgi:Holliday junction resolvasome RuvABC endonuclease subunit
MEICRILGIDPGMKRLGLAVVERNEKGNIVLLTHGLIHNPRDVSSYNEYLNKSIHEIVVDFSRFLGLTNPDIVVAELVPPGRLRASSELVFSAITVCKVLAYQWDIEWRDVAANSVKCTVVADGNATKAKVKNAMITMFPRLADSHQKEKEKQKNEGVKPMGLPQDVFDAVAIAYTGLLKHEENLNERTASHTERNL